MRYYLLFLQCSNFLLCALSKYKTKGTDGHIFYFILLSGSFSLRVVIELKYFNELFFLQIDHIFLTRVCSETAGGLPGICFIYFCTIFSNLFSSSASHVGCTKGLYLYYLKGSISKPFFLLDFHSSYVSKSKWINFLYFLVLYRSSANFSRHWRRGDVRK